MININEIKDGMIVYLYNGISCDVIQSEGELYLIDSDSGEDIGTVKNWLSEIEDYKGREEK